MSKTIKKEEIEKLFNKFSYPMTRAATTSDQKQASLGLSKILWLAFVSNNDSEENIYNTLDQIVKNHENSISFSSLYFYKMKKNLTRKEARMVQKYYSNKDNFNELENWFDQF
ncbi:hypothetical protein [uncultured Desulfobacter sp.]|uniref:hypothetical protein n=1 Tax=uncultured Desulfobacter sp. TaxID=240139 RepID=UPI0029F4FCC4|nr:hypothetical protein [uncultured Desulfobacter sp.]